jgi:hypothetical protein
MSPENSKSLFNAFNTMIGWEGIYDIFWMCNLALLIGSFGMILDRAVLIGTEQYVNQLLINKYT